MAQTVDLTTNARPGAPEPPGSGAATGNRSEQTLSVADAIRNIVTQPRRYLLDQWNWKSAVTSAVIRGLLFFATNISAGFQAATWALLLQFVYRAATSGFWGSITQAMRYAQPRWLAGLTVGVGLTALAHLLEFLIHWWGGTAELKRSVIVSIGFTVISNLFNLYVMQRNALVVGDEGDSLWKDMARMPRLIGGFVAWPFTVLLRGAKPRSE
jgi:hypothetical protein